MEIPQNMIEEFTIVVNEFEKQESQLRHLHSLGILTDDEFKIAQKDIINAARVTMGFGPIEKTGSTL